MRNQPFTGASRAEFQPGWRSGAPPGTGLPVRRLREYTSPATKTAIGVQIPVPTGGGDAVSLFRFPILAAGREKACPSGLNGPPLVGGRVVEKGGRAGASRETKEDPGGRAAVPEAARNG